MMGLAWYSLACPGKLGLASGRDYRRTAMYA